MDDRAGRISRVRASLMRVWGLMRKETFQIIRDPSSIALALVMPVVLLILFGYGVTFDAENVKAAVVMEDSGPVAQELYARLLGSRYFAPKLVGALEQAKQMLASREVAAIFHVQSSFDRKLQSLNEAPIQVLVNGIDANRSRLISGYATGIIAEVQAGLARPQGGFARLDPRIWFNENLESTKSLVPGLVALIMTLTGLLLTALVLVREKERGTMEALLVTPVRAREIMVAKLVPYFALGMSGLILTVTMARFLFDVPVRGSFPAILAMSSLFMLASLGFGLFISSVAPGQMVASQVSVVVGFLPAFFLSGLLFDLQTQPRWTQVISTVIPTTYFIDAAKTLFLAGDFWGVLWKDALVLGLMAVFLFYASRKKLKKRLA